MKVHVLYVRNNNFLNVIFDKQKCLIFIEYRLLLGFNFVVSDLYLLFKKHYPTIMKFFSMFISKVI